MSRCDVMFLQEHWLQEGQIQPFSCKLDKYECSSYLISGMPSNIVHEGRPYGGCGIIWRRNLNFRVLPISTSSSRLCCSVLELNSIKILAACAYMPCDCSFNNSSNIDEFCSVLEELSRVCIEQNIDFIVFGGDLNTDLKRSSPHTLLLNQFMANENLKSCLKYHGSKVTYTFESKINNAMSLIDHFYVTENLFNFITGYEVLIDVDNPSDHVPVTVSFKCSMFDSIYTAASFCSPVACLNKIMWDKANAENIELYKKELDNALSRIEIPTECLECYDPFCCDHGNQLEVFCSLIIDACMTASVKALPSSSTNRGNKPKVIPGWNENVKSYRDNALFWHHIWKANDCPSNGIIADIRHNTRRDYHDAIKRNSRQDEQVKANKIAAHFMSNDTRKFWDCIRKVRGNAVITPSVVDHAKDDKSICDLFAKKYNELFNSVGYNGVDIERDVDNGICNTCCGGKCYDTHCIDLETVKHGVKKLKPNKNDGYIGYCTNHLIHGTETLFTYIQHLFNGLLHHGYTPQCMLVSTIVSIPKNRRKSLNMSDNYRGIALSSIFGKLFECIIAARDEHFLTTCHLQFGGKMSHSTTHCSFVFSEVINYYTSRNTNVHVLFLDASKAFDRVNLDKLFDILLARGMCPLTIRYLIYSHKNQSIRTQWKNEFSEPFKATNGVKQGGVLSSTLFEIYLDELFKELEQSSVGCYMGNIFVGALGFVDDTTLLAPSRGALKELYSICAKFAINFDLIFNTEKSFYMVFGPGDPQYPPIRVNGVLLYQVKKVKYLGNYVTSDTTNGLLENLTADFISRSNTIGSQFSKAMPSIKYMLFKTFSLSLYGCTLLDFSHYSINSFYVAWRKSIRRLHALPNRCHSNLLHLICNDVPIDLTIHARFTNWFFKCIHNVNTVTSFCAMLALYGSCSPACNNLNFLAHKYNFCKADILESVPHLSPSVPNNELQRQSALVKDLLTMRWNKSSGFSSHEINFMIEYITTT